MEMYYCSICKVIDWWHVSLDLETGGMEVKIMQWLDCFYLFLVNIDEINLFIV
jgi:hypothetical protein